MVWDDNNWWIHTLLIGYNQIREHEENALIKMQLEILAQSRLSL